MEWVASGSPKGLVLGALVVLLGSCEPSSRPHATPAVDAAPVVADRLVDAATIGPGEAYFRTHDHGFVRLSRDGRFERIAAEVGEGPDGTLYTIDGSRGTTRHLRVPSDPAGATVVIDPSLGDLVAITRLPGGRLWALGWRTAGHWNGATWSIMPTSMFGGWGAPKDLLVDRSGVVWVAGSDKIYRDRGRGFEEMPAGLLPDWDHPVDLFSTPGGEVVVATDRGRLFRVANDAWAEIDLGTRERSPCRLYRADGSLIACVQDHLIVIARDGSRRAQRLDTIEAPPTEIRALAEDDLHRLWVAADVGVLVLDPELDSILRWWPTGAVPELQGRVTEIVVTAAPPLPEPGPLGGRIHGRVVRGEQPVAGVEVQICLTTPEHNGSGEYTEEGTYLHPCAPDWDEPSPSVRTTTRSDGSFDFWEMEPGVYNLAVQLKRGKDRVRLIDPEECCDLKQWRTGQTFDLGTIRLPGGR